MSIPSLSSHLIASARMTFRWWQFWGRSGGVLTGLLLVADKTGMGRSRWSVQALIRSAAVCRDLRSLGYLGANDHPPLAP